MSREKHSFRLLAARAEGHKFCGLERNPRKSRFRPEAIMNPEEGGEVLVNGKSVLREHVSLCQNFALLGKLEEGQKLMVRDDDLAIDNSLFPFIQRYKYWNNQDRKLIRDKIRSIMERGQNCLKTLLNAYTSLRESAYKPGNTVGGHPSISACETEFHLRQLVNMLYDHMLQSIQGLQKLTRTYASDAVYSTSFKQIGIEALAFLQRFNLIWAYQHEQLKLHSKPFCASSTESRQNWSAPTEDQDFSIRPAPQLANPSPDLTAFNRHQSPLLQCPILGKPPPFDHGGNAAISFQQLYVPIGGPDGN